MTYNFYSLDICMIEDEVSKTVNAVLDFDFFTSFILVTELEGVPATCHHVILVVMICALGFLPVMHPKEDRPVAHRPDWHFRCKIKC